MINNQTAANLSVLPRIRLFGDHSRYHCGCQAVIYYLKSQLKKIGRLVDKGEYDILVVNGEGSMHHSKKSFYRKMQMFEEAISSFKPAYLINTVWQANTNEFDHTLRSLNGIIVRESLSHENLLGHHGIQSLIRLDASYWIPVKESVPSMDFGKRIVVGDFYSKSRGAFYPIESVELKKLPFINMERFRWSSLVKSLRTASLFVTGRHHGVFAACRARIPFVAITGNSHKIDGIIKMSGLPIPVCKDPQELESAIRWASENTATYHKLFNWMDQQARFCAKDLGLQEMEQTF